MTIRIILIFICLLPIEQVYGQGMLINEIMANNGTTIQDVDSDYCDWIELYNNSNEAISLLNYRLSDDMETPDKWTFPDVIVSAHGHIIIFASGKNRSNIDELHTNFKISSSGEEIILSNDSGGIIDRIDSETLEEDQVYGRFPDGSDNWLKSFNSSPGSPNTGNNTLLFSTEQGFHTSPFYLKIFSGTGDQIFYTINGSVPTESSALYSDSLLLGFTYLTPNYFSEISTTPEQSLISYKAWESPDVIIDKAIILRSASYKDGIRTSRIHTKTFFVESTVFRKFTLPIVSLVTDSGNLFSYDSGIYVPGKHYDPENPQWSGNYFQEGIEWERPVHIEYFERNGDLGFSQDAGIRIQGFKTRQASQKSLKLYARKEYGTKYFNYQLLPQKSNNEYKRFQLATSMGSWRGNTIIHDVLASEIVRGLDLEYQDYQPVIVYLNGEYWGLQTLKDRIDERYIAYTYEEYDKDSIDIINGNFWLVEAGSNKHYKELVEFIESNDLSIEDNYKYVLKQIDIDNFIDYLIAETFFSNKDWPGNNQRLWRPQSLSGKWRWIFFDIDAGYGDYTANMLANSLMSDLDRSWKELPVSVFLFRNLLKNNNFVIQFIHRYEEILKTDFEKGKTVRKLNAIKELYEAEIPNHIARWHYPTSVSEWERDIVDNLLIFLKERPCAVAAEISAYFNLSDFGFECNPGSSKLEHIILAPNPNTGTFYLYNDSSEAFSGSLSIMDLSGRAIYYNAYVFLEEWGKEYFNLPWLSSGLYILSLYNNNQYSNMRLVILN